MGKIAGVELYGGRNEKCGRCGMTEKKGGCCSDELKVYKLEDVHKQVNSLGLAQMFACAMPVASPVMDWQLPATPAFEKIALHPPPDIGSPSLYIVNRVFRI